MPISEKDREFMEKVAAYFDGTKTLQESRGSIRDTALKFGINRNKIRKILITMGRLESPITEEAVRLRQKGMSIKEIAHDLGVSVATTLGSDPFAEMLIINYGNVTLATGIENIDKEQVMPYNSYIRIHPFTR